MQKEIELRENYSEKNFLIKLVKIIRKAGEDLLTHASTLYFTLKDKDTPKWAKAKITAALGYFIIPIDAIPDAIPAAGLADDLGVLTAAIAMVHLYIKDEHRLAGREFIGRLFRINRT